MSGGRAHAKRQRSGVLVCGECSRASGAGLVLSGKQMLCAECLGRKQRRRERHEQNHGGRQP
jgi:hypothetical protein